MVNWRADKLALRNCRRRTLSFGLPNVEQRLRERANSRRPACGPSFLVLRCPRTSPSPGLSSQRPILAEENPPPPPPVFKTSLQFPCDFVVYDFPKTSKSLGGGGIPRQKRRMGERGGTRFPYIHSRNPVLPWAGLPIPGQSRLRWFFRVWGGVVPGQTVRRPALFEFSPQCPAEMFGIFGATPPPPRPKPRSGPTKSPRAEETEPRAGGR